jgi:hypothetical protein
MAPGKAIRWKYVRYLHNTSIEQMLASLLLLKYIPMEIANRVQLSLTFGDPTDSTFELIALPAFP